MFLGIAIFLTQSGDNDGTELRKKLALTTEYSNWILLPNGFKAQLGDTNSRPGQRYAEKPLQARKTSKNSIFYPDAGIYFYRSRLDQEPKNDTWKMLKCGYHKLTHKHADDGSFMLYSKGYEIFTDGGIYGYTNDAFRKYFTSSLSHNSVVVDGESYDISEENAAKVGISMLQSGNIDHVRASNNAYKGVSWIRDLASIDDLTVLQDRLSSEEMHEYAQVFHLAEDISVLQAGDDEVVLGVADTGYRVRLRQYGATKQLEIVTGDLQRPGYGLLSRGENHVAVSTDLIFRVKAANTNFTTVIAIEDAEGLVRIYEKKEFVDKLQYDPVKNTFQLSL